MKSYMKAIIIPVVSAVVGGLAVVWALKLSPNLRAKLETAKNQEQIPGQMKEQIKGQESYFDEILEGQNKIQKQFDDLFANRFFNKNDPFEEMKEMREEMERSMERLRGKTHSRINPFDSWYSDKFGGGTIDDISRREDDSYVYYDIKVDDIQSTSINTKIENGYIAITGTQEKKINVEDVKEGVELPAESYYKSTFNRVFPLPENVDSSKMEMVTEKNRIVLKFPKLKV